MLFRAYTMTGRHDGPHLLFTAGVHGDEWEPMVALRELWGTIRKEDLSGRLTVVPVLNEPAYGRGNRVGDDGLDLARVFPGDPNGSTTQRIAFELSTLMQEADFYVDLHTGGVQLRLWPLAGYLIHANPGVLEQQRKLARAFNLPFVWGTDANLNGRTLSQARDLEIPAIYAEYLGSVPFCDEAVTAYVDGCRNVMVALEMLRAEPPVERVRFVAEDSRPGAGHLQVCHPAPAKGLFRPAVQLGAKITVGEPLGFFTGDEPKHSMPIIAENSGRVVSLRCLPRVQVGDGLGVVVDVTEVQS